MSEKPKKNEGGTMETLADTVGLVPNIKKNDNLIQGAVVGGGTLLAAVGTYIVTGNTEQVLVATAISLIVLGILSGLVLMVLGWVRTAKKMK